MERWRWSGWTGSLNWRVRVRLHRLGLERAKKKATEKTPVKAAAAKKSVSAEGSCEEGFEGSGKEEDAAKKKTSSAKKKVQSAAEVAAKGDCEEGCEGGREEGFAKAVKKSAKRSKR